MSASVLKANIDHYRMKQTLFFLYDLSSFIFVSVVIALRVPIVTSMSTCDLSGFTSRNKLCACFAPVSVFKQENAKKKKKQLLNR